MTPPARVVIAVDSFKGSITAAAACTALRDGWRQARPDDDVRTLPLADGGEGTVAAFAAAHPAATWVPVSVTGPDDAPVTAHWLLLPATERDPRGVGVIELAAASGIELLHERLRPLTAHTHGFGETIAAALAHGVSRLVLGIGSSASTDGGVGMLCALGAKATAGDGTAIGCGGGALSALSALDLSGVVSPPAHGVIVLTDVDIPLLGPRGAAATFAPQKGANESDIAALEVGLAGLAELIDVDPQTPGAGAAGGTGFALLAWGAQLTSGASAVAELVGLDSALAHADVIVTGEGAFDASSLTGKVVGYVSAHSPASADVLLVAGRVAPNTTTERFMSVTDLTELAGSAAAAMADPAHWLMLAGRAAARQFED